MKTLYVARHAISDWSDPSLFDEERKVTKEGIKSAKAMGDYLKDQNVSPDIILTSCAIRAQDTALELAETLRYQGTIHYLKELYLTPLQRLKETLSLQSCEYDNLLLIGHNSQLTELINDITEENIEKIPAMGIMAIKLDINEWTQLQDTKGIPEFFIAPQDIQASMAV